MKRPPVRAVLCLLIAYQTLMYGFILRAYLHMSVVLLPWLIGEAGYTLYGNINIGYPPGWLWLNSAFYQLIPDHVFRLRLGTLLIASAITLLVYWVGRRWWSAWAGLAAAALFAVWGTLMLEYLMYFELALGLLTVMALAVWHQRESKGWQPFVAGVLIGLAVIVKQHALAIAAVFVIWRLFDRHWRSAFADVVRFGIGAALPVIAVLIVLAAQGVLEYGLYLMLGSHGAYFENASQPFELREATILLLWLALVPPFVLPTLRRREPESAHYWLILGLFVALCVPAYPRYGRFHLAGAVPLVALISAGTLVMIFQQKRRVWRLYGALAAAAMIGIGVALPVYYRVRLGIIENQYGALESLSVWVHEQTDASAGTRIWVLPDIDPTTNFYAISGYFPPAQYAETYPWIVLAPPVLDRMFAGMESDPPAYIIQVDDWRFQIPDVIRSYMDAHYTRIAQTVLPTEINNVTLYRRNTS